MLSMKKMLLLVALLLSVSPFAETCFAQNYDIISVMELAQKGDRVAQFTIANCYLDGAGLPYNPAAGVHMLILSSNQYFAPAQCELGVLFYNGRFVQQDIVTAVKLYQSSAAQGYAPAEVLLGDCYINGIVVPQNNNKAIKLYQSAASKGNIFAIQRLNVLGIPVK